MRAYGRSPVGLSLMASLSIQLLGVATGILLARILGPALRGELAAVLLWPTLLMMVGSVGVIDAVTFHTARRTASLRTLLGTTVGLAGLQGLVVLLIGLAVIPLVFADRSSEAELGAFAYLAVIPLGLLALYLMALLNGEARFGWFSFLRVLVIVAQAIGLAVLALLGELTIITAVIAYLAGVALTGFVAAVVAIRDAGGVGPFQASVARALFAFGWRSQLSTLSNLLNERLDQLVISIALAPAKLGLYVVAWTLTSFTGLIGVSVAFVALPSVAGRSTDAERVADARRYASLTLAASLLVVLPLVAAAPLVVEIAFGEQFEDATGVARILLVASVALALARVLESVLKGLDRPLEAGIAEGIALAVTVVALAALIPLLGITGAAIASLLAYTTCAAYAVRRVTLALPVTAPGLLLPGRDTIAAGRAVLADIRAAGPRGEQG